MLYIRHRYLLIIYFQSLGFSQSGLSVVDLYTNTPIGCAGPYDLSKLTCNITWLPYNIEECQSAQTVDPSITCGVTFQAQTIAGFETGQQETDRNIPLLNIDGTFDMPYLVKFSSTQFSGHSFWDGYTLPDSKVSFF